VTYVENPLPPAKADGYMNLRRNTAIAQRSRLSTAHGLIFRACERGFTCFVPTENDARSCSGSTTTRWGLSRATRAGAHEWRRSRIFTIVK